MILAHEQVSVYGGQNEGHVGAYFHRIGEIGRHDDLDILRKIALIVGRTKDQHVAKHALVHETDRVDHQKEEVELGVQTHARVHVVLELFVVLVNGVYDEEIGDERAQTTDESNEA